MKRTIGVITAVSILLAACSGRSGENMLPSPPSAKPAVKAAISFVMHWPHKNTSLARTPKYISPATQSVIIQVNPTAPSPGPVTFANISGATGNPPTSTVDIDAPVGSDDIVIQLYDAQQTAGEATANGNLVGQTEVSQTISAGQLNTISATVDGVVNGVQIVPLANEPTAESTQSGFNLVGTVPVAFEVNALDADGNIIVPPGTVPVTTLSPYGSGVSVTPVPGTANQFSVRVTAPASKTAFPSLYAGATDTYGDTVNSIITIKPVSAVYVGYASGGVALYDGFGKALSLPGAAFGGVKDPVALAYDYDDNYVFVADTGQGKLLAFDPLGNPVPGFAAPSVPGISGVTYDSNNKMIYAVGTSGISSYTTTGTAASATGAPSNATAIAFVANDSRNSTLNELAVCIRGGAPAIGIYSEAALQTNSFAIAGGPTSVAYAPYHTGVVQQIYDVRSGNIDGYDTSGGSALTVTDANNPFGAAIDQNNNDVYVTEQTTNAIVPYLSNLSAIDSAAASITTPSASGMSSPAGIAIAY